MIGIRVSNTKKYLFATGAVLLVALAFIASQIVNQKANAAGESLLGASSISGNVYVGQPITGLQISATGNPTIPVNLRASNGTIGISPTTGVTITKSASGKAVTLNGTVNDINTALATATYTGKSVGSDTIEISLVGEGVVYYPGNNHLYEFVADNSVDWVAAQAAAAARTRDGLTGYLATITSAEENAFVTERLEGAGWMGGSDVETEDDWKWVTGPETGTSFWAGGTDGSTVDGEYANWAPGDEPNNAGDEDCTQFLSGGTGLWNDLPCTETTIDGYVVEYGAPGQLASVATKNIAVTTSLATFDAGDGSVGAPYQVSDCQRFQAMNQDPTAHYVLTANIDCTETADWDGGRGFTPIGYGDYVGDNDYAPFTGSLNGNGFTVDNITILRADDDQGTNPYNSEDQGYVGVFGYTDNATIQNFNVTNSIVKGYGYVGGIIGFMYRGTLTNTTFNIGTADNDCSPGDCVWARYGEQGGGLVGYLSEGIIVDSRSAGPVKGSGKVIGGLVGVMNSGSITNSSSSSNIDGGQFIGGAIGMMNGGTASRIFATGNIDANLAEDASKDGKYGGGLIGSLEGGKVSESYATGNVHVDTAVGGGFVGVLFSNADNEITDSYATGNVTTDGNAIGGFVGEIFEGTIDRTYASGSVTSPNGVSGSFAGRTYNTAYINDSFGVGEVSNGSGFVGDAFNNPQFAENYYDSDTTGQAICDDGETQSSPACTAISDSGYFIDYSNRPFTQDDDVIWDNSAVWYFDGINLPVLRMGVNATASALPFIAGDEDEDTSGDTSSGAAAVGAPNTGANKAITLFNFMMAGIVAIVATVISAMLAIKYVRSSEK